MRFIDRAKAAGVKHIVKLSAFGSEMEPGIQLGRWHRAIERHLEASGIRAIGGMPLDGGGRVVRSGASPGGDKVIAGDACR